MAAFHQDLSIDFDNGGVSSVKSDPSQTSINPELPKGVAS
jgi:hypothetical protein